MSVSGIILVALGNWTLLDTTTRTLLLLCGAILCFFGIILIPSWLIYRSQAVSERQSIKGDEAA
jgi:tellurite resistance protein TehA-like permease